MRSLFVIQSGRQRWHVLPWVALRSAMISAAVLVITLFALDRIALPLLERRGLTAGEEWKRHNTLVTTEHRKKDTTNGGGLEVPVAERFSVRSWTGHPVSPQKNAAIRILVMGDSFVWGSPYLTLNHMWWRQLENDLCSQGFDVEVIAAGQSGASTRDQVVVARRVIPEYKPDLIIWGYVTNDADVGRIPQISWSQQSLPGFNRIKGWAARLWPRLVAQFDAHRSHKLAKAYTGAKYGYEYNEWELKLVEPDNLTAYRKVVEDVKGLMDEHKLPGFMMTLPHCPSTRHFAQRHEPIIALWHDVGVPTHNILPEFVNRHGEAPDSGPELMAWGINPADGHPGPRACRFLGEQAARIVSNDFGHVVGSPTKRNESHLQINDWLPHLTPPPRSDSDSAGHFLEMTYPDEDSCPAMPLGVPTPLFAFKQPVPLSSLSLTGSDLDAAQIWVSFLDPKELYDDGEWHDLGLRRGAKLTWTLPAELAGRKVSVVRFRGSFRGSDRRLTWRFSEAATANMKLKEER